MKLRSAVLIVLLVIFADQALKIWIKTHFPFGHITNMLGLPWARLYFIENEGMAWGWKFGGDTGKMVLTLFRLAAVIFGTWYLGKIVREKYSRGFIVCASLIYAGALGNLIDSMFYGMLFSSSDYSTIAHMFPQQGYAGFLHGRVVDMLYFPMVHSRFPDWLPLIGGAEFEFFSPIFNIADAAISVGVIVLLLFQKRFFRREGDEEVDEEVAAGAQAGEAITDREPIVQEGKEEKE
ncbi:lipoprotein signal peptidase [Paraflavisolibacter sp. H34]|uniref:lipoprotein signal peptidase n=1 Tax=Huijunlia imazamoxiresistens TaxID=3127457 RepID=UPI003018AA23